MGLETGWNTAVSLAEEVVGKWNDCHGYSIILIYHSVIVTFIHTHSLSLIHSYSHSQSTHSHSHSHSHSQSTPTHSHSHLQSLPSHPLIFPLISTYTHSFPITSHCHPLSYSPIQMNVSSGRTLPNSLMGSVRFVIVLRPKTMFLFLSISSLIRVHFFSCSFLVLILLFLGCLM